MPNRHLQKKCLDSFETALTKALNKNSLKATIRRHHKLSSLRVLFERNLKSNYLKILDFKLFLRAHFQITRESFSQLTKTHLNLLKYLKVSVQQIHQKQQQENWRSPLTIRLFKNSSAQRKIKQNLLRFNSMQNLPNLDSNLNQKSSL